MVAVGAPLAITVRVAALLMTMPEPFDTKTRKLAPLSAADTGDKV